MSIPKINLQNFTPEELGEAFHTTGFVRVTNVGLDKKIVKKAYSIIKKFFKQSEADKMEIFDPACGGQRGYTPGESPGGEPDPKEFFSLGRDENMWPDNLEMEGPLEAYRDELDEKIRIPIECALSTFMGQEENFLTEMNQDGDALLRAIRYEKNLEEGEVLARAHTDINLFTILPMASKKGLQVQMPDGSWLDVTIKDTDTVILNAGDMLKNMSNGDLESSVHQVLAKGNTRKARHSIVFFIHARPNDPMDPLPTMIEKTGGVPLYPKATERDLLFERLEELELADESIKRHVETCGIQEKRQALSQNS